MTPLICRFRPNPFLPLSRPWHPPTVEPVGTRPSATRLRPQHRSNGGITMTDLPSITRRSLITAAGAAGAATLLTGAGAIPAQAATRLTNLAHLDALTTTVRLPVT